MATKFATPQAFPLYTGRLVEMGGFPGPIFYFPFIQGRRVSFPPALSESVYERQHLGQHGGVNAA